MHKTKSHKKLVNLLENSKYFQKLVEDKPHFKNLHLLRPKVKTKPRTSICHQIASNKVHFNLKLFKLKEDFVTKNKKIKQNKNWRSNLNSWKKQLYELNRGVRNIQKENQPKDYLNRLVEMDDLESMNLTNEFSKFVIKRKKLKRNYESMPNNLLMSFDKMKKKENSRDISFKGFRKISKKSVKKSHKFNLSRVKSSENLQAPKVKKGFFRRKSVAKFKKFDYYKIKSRLPID